MVEPVIPSSWLKKHQLSQNLSGLFRWKRGFFGLKLKAEIKRVSSQIDRFTIEVKYNETEYNDLTINVRTLEKRLEKILDGKKGSDDPEVLKLDAEIKQSRQTLRAKNKSLGDIRNSLTIAQNDLRLITNYQDMVVMNAQEAMATWTGDEVANIQDALENVEDDVVIGNPNYSEE
jgi:chromosome segregation ATPase